MRLSRRYMLAFAGLATLMGAIGWAGESYAEPPSPLPPFSQAVFAPFVGSTVTAIDAAGKVSHLTLVEITEKKYENTHNALSLVLKGPLNQTLPQDTYYLGLPSLDNMPILMVPIGAADSHGCYYQVIFTQMLQPTIV